jgi:hypothetical protein
MAKTCWKEMIEQAMAEKGESWGDVVSIAPLDLDLHKEFYNGYGGTEGRPFTLWTTNRVYFPAQYDGSEWVESVARNPDGEPTDHVGGG